MPFNFKLLNTNFNFSNSFRCTQDAYSFDVTNYFLSASLGLKGKLPYIDYYPYNPPANLGELISENCDHFIGTEPEQKKKSWSLGFSYSYSKNKNSGDYRSDLHSNLSINLTEKLSIKYSNYYNFKMKELISQSITLGRDLHCWTLNFSWEKSGDYWSYRFKVSANKLPDLKFRHSDHKAWD